MEAGYAKRCITPPRGTAMAGWSDRDRAHGCESVHDDLHVRAAAFRHEAEAALLLAFDLLFVGREQCDRLKGAIGRRLDLLPRQILINATHNHAGPADGSYGFAVVEPQDTLYQEQFVAAAVAAAETAWATATPVTISAGVGRTDQPLSRRRADAAGRFQNAPNPAGEVYDKLPLALFRTPDGEPIVCLCSASMHPTIFQGWAISAEWPGVVCDRLDARLGAACTVFLQGCGGDAKPRAQCFGDVWRTCGYEQVVEAGEAVADAAWETIGDGLSEVPPQIATATVEVHWPLTLPLPDADTLRLRLEAVVHPLHRASVQRQLDRFERGMPLPEAAPLTLQGITLGEGLRLIGLEGEAVAALGHQMERCFGGPVTFPLGYSNGTGLYLVTSAQLAEGGYEPESYWEYYWPTPPAAGLEGPLEEGLERLRSRGIA